MRAIIAVNSAGYIGLNNKLPWKCSEDLKHFKRLTNGCNLLVGYNTYQTLPKLENRRIQLDHDEFLLMCERLKDADEELKFLADNVHNCWCIGGKKTYEKYCHLFKELHISHINDNTTGDTLYPNFSNLNPDCKIFNYYFEPNI